jgi:flagellar biosynthesis GTPase FlhF
VTDSASTKPPAAEEQEKSSSLFSKIFGRNKEEPAEPKAKPEPEPKKGIIRSWFKSSQPKPEEPAPKAKKSAALPAQDAGLLLANLVQQQPYVLAQFGLFNRKKDTESDAVASSEAAVKQAKKEVSAREAEAKAAAKELAKREAEAQEAKEKALKEATRQERDAAKKKAVEEKAAAEQKAREEKDKDKKDKNATPPANTAEKSKAEATTKKTTASTTTSRQSKSRKAKPSPAPAVTSKPVVRTSTSLSLTDYAKVLQRPDAKEILSRMAANLNSLAQRAHPCYRTVIAEYLVLVGELAAGKTAGMDAHIAALQKHTDDATKLSTNAQTYLDWYQANHPSTKGSEFEEYLSIKQVVKRELAPRVDEISLYLDEWERKQKR